MSVSSQRVEDLQARLFVQHQREKMAMAIGRWNGRGGCGGAGAGGAGGGGGGDGGLQLCFLKECFVHHKLAKLQMR